MAKKAQKPSDAEQVTEYMKKLVHPLKTEIEAVKSIIKQSDPRISERIKWNAPSYYFIVDLVTFNHRMEKKVHLVFHNEAIVHIKSALLEGDHKDRRMMYFKDMDEVQANQPELERILREYMDLVERRNAPTH